MLYRLAGRMTHRLIASRFPPIRVFDFVPDPEAAEAALVLEGLTGERLSDTLGRPARISP